MPASTGKYLIIDADIIIHFFKGGRIADIHRIFHPLKIKVPDIVMSELEDTKHHKKRKEIQNLLNFRLIEEIKLEAFGHETVKEFLDIRRLQLKGKGESACMAIARKNQDAILSSSNMRDTCAYCKMHNLPYLTTMDFLCVAIKKKIFTVDECDVFIKNVLDNGSKLPVTNMAAHQCRDTSHIIN